MHAVSKQEAEELCARLAASGVGVLELEQIFQGQRRATLGALDSAAEALALWYLPRGNEAAVERLFEAAPVCSVRSFLGAANRRSVDVARVVPAAARALARVAIADVRFPENCPFELLDQILVALRRAPRDALPMQDVVALLLTVLAEGRRDEEWDFDGCAEIVRSVEATEEGAAFVRALRASLGQAG